MDSSIFEFVQLKNKVEIIVPERRNQHRHYACLADDTDSAPPATDLRCLLFLWFQGVLDFTCGILHFSLGLSRCAPHLRFVISGPLTRLTLRASADVFQLAFDSVLVH
jgi:hypothetical protein